MYLSSLRVNIAPGSVRSASAAVRFYTDAIPGSFFIGVADTSGKCAEHDIFINFTTTGLSVLFSFICTMRIADREVKVFFTTAHLLVM